MRIDMTTGDAITPGEIDYQYRSIFGKEKIIIKAYTHLKRYSPRNTRPFKKNCVEFSSQRFVRRSHSFQTEERPNLFSCSKKAIENTALRRGSSNTIVDYESIVSEIMDSEYQKRLWKNYQNENSYAKNIQFNDAVETVKTIGDLLKKSDRLNLH